MKRYFSLILAIAATVSAQIVPSTGNVRGPTSATDNAVARYDGTTGKLIQNSGVTIDDSGNLTVSGAGNSSVAGNWLVGTTTDTGGRLVVDKASQAADSNTSSSAITVANLAGGNAVLDIGVSSTYLGYLQTRNYTTGSYYQLNLQPAGGNVLIGTTTDLGQKLQVNGTAYVSGVLKTGGNINLANAFFINGRNAANTADVPIVRVSASDVLSFGEGGYNATFAGAIAIGNTVNTVSPTSPNRTITMVIGGTTYYIHAKTTND